MNQHNKKFKCILFSQSNMIYDKTFYKSSNFITSFHDDADMWMNYIESQGNVEHGTMCVSPNALSIFMLTYISDGTYNFFRWGKMSIWHLKWFSAIFSSSWYIAWRYTVVEDLTVAIWIPPFFFLSCKRKYISDPIVYWVFIVIHDLLIVLYDPYFCCRSFPLL